MFLALRAWHARGTLWQRQTVMYVAIELVVVNKDGSLVMTYVMPFATQFMAWQASSVAQAQSVVVRAASRRG